MVSIILTRRALGVVTGTLIFFVPFLTYLSPENLELLTGIEVLEIFLLLIPVLFIIFIGSFGFEIILKRFLKKEILLFPLFCFAFYLNFSYEPFTAYLQEFLYLRFGFIRPILTIFFEFLCLTIIVLGAKFNIFSIRAILIFSVFMLINALIPLLSYLGENIGKYQEITYEIPSKSYDRDDVLKERNIYFIILDEMMSIETAERLNIASKIKVIDNLSNTELTYIDKSRSSYSGSHMTMTSIMLMDYHQKPDSPKNSDISRFFPSMMYDQNREIPLIALLKKANSSFFWASGHNFVCLPSTKWTCINSVHYWLPNHVLNFYSTTPLVKVIRDIGNSSDSKDTIGPFLDFINKNGVPKTPFFAYIHHNIPHSPFLVTNECQPTTYFFKPIEGYKASYHCALKSVQNFMEKINNSDPEAIVIFQADHGIKTELNLGLTLKEKHSYRGQIFNAIKAPEQCFEKYGLPKTNVNTIRFAFNCAYGFKLPYRKNIYYQSTGFGELVEIKTYE